MAKPTKRAAAEAQRDTGSAGETRSRTGRGRTRRAPGEHSALGEKLIGTVPARIMRPRIIFIACLAALVAFGLLMVYSSSSVEALSEYGSSTYFLTAQLKNLLVALAAAAVALAVSMSVTRSALMWGAWAFFTALLAAVLVVGEESGGATRWIVIAGFQFQPSELEKPVVILTAAMIMNEFYGEHAIDGQGFVVRMAIALGVPILLLILEPDFGTCIIIVGTVFLMCVLAGISGRLVGSALLIIAVVGIGAIAMEPYRLARFMTMLDPWQDAYGDGYQATLAIMAFASGGLFGRGIGNSTMKYNYLPEAHNDYILAIIGEEVGFVGTLVFFAVVAGLVYSGFKIAEQAPTTQGKMIAYGCSAMIGLQYLINIMGIVGVTPMTGKPLPFISYGGSALIGAFILAALVLRVSLESNPKTVYDARRAGMRVLAEDEDAAGLAASPVSRGIEGSTAGVPHPRSARRHEGFTVVDGMGVVTPDTRPERRGDADARPRRSTRPPRTT
ncbi:MULTISPECIES: FtsW/RodA/SpoVE family cell cycle protein [Enorma]|uniref:FtsW/RodA/SpoVE family cell cycle protein n=1 Tax=Enorma TaxID=1472762 RepID=UPI0012B86308|nr:MULTISPECIES: putative peptidoglycan glycosyltransferase FtsW [Enorma]